MGVELAGGPADPAVAAAVERYLSEHLAGFEGPLKIRQFEGGQSNPTYHLEGRSGEYVLRKKPAGELLPKAHLVEREFRIMKALEGSGVPVCRMHLLCEDTSIVGTEFFVMDFVRGRVFRDLRLPEVEREERAAIYDVMNEVLAALHSVDYRKIGLEDFGRPGNYYERQISRWSRQYVAAKTVEIAEMERLMEWLPANIPPGGEVSIVHGDYRLENMIVHPNEPRVLALLDWELSTLGHPLADLAYNSMPYHLDTYRHGGLVGNEAEASGIPGEKQYLASYCRRTGRAGIENWNFYLAFSLFRSASIAQGVYKRALQGNAASATGIQLGEGVPLIAQTAWGLAQA